MSGSMDALAQQFHEAYERLAPSYGYETRKESAVPWPDVPENNRRLMVAVMSEVIGGLRSLRIAKLEAVREAAEVLDIADGHAGKCMKVRCSCGRAALRAALDAAKESP